MSTPFARIRLRKDQAELLYDILFEERGRLIAQKIREREAGEDPAALREELLTIKYLMEESKRALHDIETQELDE
jgi:hypothetical protein